MVWILNAEKITNDKLMWYVLMHLTFIHSAMGMALIDRTNVTKKGAGEAAKS